MSGEFRDIDLSTVVRGSIRSLAECYRNSSAVGWASTTLLPGSQNRVAYLLFQTGNLLLGLLAKGLLGFQFGVLLASDAPCLGRLLRRNGRVSRLLRRHRRLGRLLRRRRVAGRVLLAACTRKLD